MAGKVTIQLDPKALAKLQRSGIDALEMAAAETLTDVRNRQVVPRNIGTLESSGYVDNTNIKKGRVRIGFDTPYARRLYWHPEYNFRTDKNPSAQGRWMNAYLPRGEKEHFIQETFGKFLKRLSKGLIK